MDVHMNGFSAPNASNHAQPLNIDELDDYVVNTVDEAIRNGWIRTYYQPVIRTVSGKVCSMEALARWEDPTYGLLPPGLFIGSLEKAGLIHKLDSCMVRQVCREYRENVDAGYPVVPISFNLSRLDFDLCDIVQLIEDAVRTYEMPRNLLNIEITESVFGTEPAFMTATISRLHDSGYQVWMDDFGSAYSSLNVLKDFDFDELKIDMAFLSRFGERSRTIIASVVDMAKRLGLQTLAEGVETEEHSEFLRHIGCEKQQGYLYGRPQPYSREYVEQLDRDLGIELQTDRRYYRTIGSVNTLSLSERDFMPDNTTKDYVTSMPLAFVEFDGELFHILDCNDPFTEALQAIGIPNVETAESLINDTGRLPARNARRLIESIRTEKYARQDYLANGRMCVMRSRFVASHPPRVTVLVTLESAASTQEQERMERMQIALNGLHAMYEHVDILDLDKRRSEPVYSQASFKEVYDIPDLHEAIRQFAENELYPADRERYLEFMNPDTMISRIENGRQGYCVGFFRTHDRGGDYAWKLFALVRLTQVDGNHVLVCIRETNWENDELFQLAYEGNDATAEDENDEMRISDGSLWRALSQSTQFGVFWKDTERRFVGCNQKFLDYYGFSSMEAILGKTDEDMQWHLDPIPFMKDELRVLEKGETVESAHGQCIVDGQLHHIVANKRPIYRNGRIVGLVGYFIDAHEALKGAETDMGFDAVPYIDPATGVLNYSGLDAATVHYIEAFQKTGIDFAMTMLDIDNFKHSNDTYGYDYSDMVLKHAADAIRNAVGKSSIIGHIYADRFVVLKQGASREDMAELSRKITDAVESIKEVGGTRCTIFVRCATAWYSEANDFDAFKRLGRDRLRALKHAEQ